MRRVSTIDQIEASLVQMDKTEDVFPYGDAMWVVEDRERPAADVGLPPGFICAALYEVTRSVSGAKGVIKRGGIVSLGQVAPTIYNVPDVLTGVYSTNVRGGTRYAFRPSGSTLENGSDAGRDFRHIAAEGLWYYLSLDLGHKRTSDALIQAAGRIAPSASDIRRFWEDSGWGKILS